MLFLYSFILITMTNAQANQMTVDSIIESVKSGNLSESSLEKSKESEKVKTGYLGRSFYPTLQFEVGEERFQTGRYRTLNNPYGMLEARFNLFRGGRDKFENSIRSLQFSIAEQNKDQNLREEVAKTRKILWNIVYNNEIIKILESSKKQNASLKEQAAIRIRRGVSTNSDLLEFKVYENEINESIESFNHESKILQIALRPLLGLTNEQKIEFNEHLDHEHDDGLIKSEFNPERYPKVIAMRAEDETFQLQKKQNYLWWTPKLDAYGGYYLYTLRDRDYLQQAVRDDTVVGIKLTFELFDGAKSYNQASSQYYQSEAKRIMTKHEIRKAESDYIMLKEELLHIHEVVHYIEERIKGSKEYLRLTLQEYDRGVKNSLDALTAMKRYFEYEKQYLDKKKEYQLVKADLLSMRGE